MHSPPDSIGEVVLGRLFDSRPNKAGLKCPSDEGIFCFRVVRPFDRIDLVATISHERLEQSG